MNKSIGLSFCRIELTEWGCLTHFVDGTSCPSVPHPHDEHYRRIAGRCGYGIGASEDWQSGWERATLQYCQEHDFAHAFIEQELYNRPSRVLHGLAQGKPLKGLDSVYEEVTAQTFQRWLRADERPIVGGVNWDELKRFALTLLS